MPPFQGSLSERVFSGGELTPAAWARVDLENYLHGLKIARNGFIQRQGGFTNRPGTAMIAKTSNGVHPVQLIPFVFSNNVSYALEFGDFYMRVYKAGAAVQVSGVGAWSSLTAYNIGDFVTRLGVTYYCTAANTNQQPPNASFWNPQTAYQLPSPFATADIKNIQYVQAKNILYMVCAGYHPVKLTCTGDASWSFANLNFVPQTSPPGSAIGFSYDPTAIPLYGYLWGNLAPNVTIGGGWTVPWNEMVAGSPITGQPGIPSGPELITDHYMVTAFDRIKGIESLPAPGNFSEFYCDVATGGGGINSGDTITLHNNANSSVISAITNANPMVMTVASAAHFSGGDLFKITGTGVPEIDGQTMVGQIIGNTITFVGVDSTSFTAFPNVNTSSPIATCLTSVVIAPPRNVNFGLNPGGLISTNTDFNTIVGGYPFVHGGGWTNLFLAILNKVFDEGPLKLTWSAPAVLGSYVFNVYKKATNGLWGFMASIPQTGAGPYTFIDDGTILPDTSKAPPVYKNNFVGSGGFPSVIGVYQQRLILANTHGQQDQVFASNVGAFEVFTTTSPTPVESDTVSFEIAGQQYNAVAQVVDNGFLLIFTSTGEFSCYGAGASNAAGALTPTGIGLVQQAFYGGSPLLRPLTIGKNVLYLQALQSKIRELIYNYYINGYSGNDLTIFSSHLFDNYTFISWAYQQEPNSLIWAVRNDGVLLSLTYIPELQLKAWTRHDTLGLFEQVVAIPEGNEHALYCVVNRFNGTRFVERFASREIPLVSKPTFIQNGENYGQIKNVMVPDETQFVFMDCSSFYDGRNTTVITMKALLGGDYNANGAGFTLNSSAPAFNIGMVGNTAVILTHPVTGAKFKCKILVSIDTSNVICRPDSTLPNSLVNINVSIWALGINALTGLDYLNGQKVSVLADGSVISSPASPGNILTVSGGALAFKDFYAFIRVGLPYISDMRALDIDTPQQGQTDQDKPQLVNRLSLMVQDTRGLWAGAKPPTDDAVDPLENLSEFKPQDYQSLGNTPKAKTGIIAEAITSEWMYGGGVFVRQIDPLPMNVLSLIPAGKYMMGG